MQPNSYYSHYYYWSEYIFQYFFLLSRKAHIASARHWVEIMSEYIRLQKKRFNFSEIVSQSTPWQEFKFSDVSFLLHFWNN